MKNNGRSPVLMILLTMLFIVVVSGACFYGMTQQPWFGFRLAPTADSQAVYVKQVDPDGPSAGLLQEGDVLRGVVLPDGELFTLTPKLIDEPNNMQTFAGFNQLIEAQKILWPLIHEPVITLQKLNGEQVELRPESSRPLSAVSIAYWIALVIGPAAAILGLLIMLRNWGQIEAALFFAVSIDYALVIAITMLFSRELAINPQLMMWVGYAENFLTHLHNVLLTTLWFTFPSRLISFRWALSISAIGLLFPLNCVFQWYEFPHAFMFSFAITVPFMFTVGYFQWQRSRINPKSRAIVGWMIFSYAFALSIGWPLFVFPTLIGAEPFVPVELARTLIIGSFYFLMALAVARYRLFDVERWWFRLFLWLIGGALVIALDVLLVMTLHLSKFAALSAALVLAGFLYFPIRQWLLGRFVNRGGEKLETGVRDLAVALTAANSETAYEREWLDFLQRRFDPAESHLDAQTPLSCGKLEEQGLNMFVPSLNGTGCYVFQGKYGGRRLFSPRDVELTDSLLEVARHSRDARLANEKVAREERYRVMSDLHDTLGAKLLSLTQRSNDPDFQFASRDALQTLRETVRLSAREQASPLIEQLADWRAEIRERLEPRGIELRWEAALSDESLTLETTQVLAFSNILRETVNNALRHAKPSWLQVSITQQNGHLKLAVSHDGVAQAPWTWQEGFGLSNLQKQVKRLGGEHVIAPREGEAFPGAVSIAVSAPLQGEVM